MCLQLYLCILIQRRLGRIGQGDQFSGWILFRGERSLRLWIDDGQHLAAVDSPDDKAVPFDGNHSISLSEDRRRLLHGNGKMRDFIATAIGYFEWLPDPWGSPGRYEMSVQGTSCTR